MPADGAPPPEPEDLVTVREAAQLVGVTPDTVWRWLQRGLYRSSSNARDERIRPRCRTCRYSGRSGIP
jgi:hypothetical protein